MMTQDSDNGTACTLENMRLVHRILNPLKQRGILTGNPVPAVCGQRIQVSAPLESARNTREALGVTPLAPAEIMCPECEDIYEALSGRSLATAA